MSTDFDPYYKWLGITPKDQPPNHYRLLGIERFEEDREVIDAAANRVMAYLKTLATGNDLEPAQKLLNEVVAARQCLLNPDRKAAYDGQLNQESGASVAVAPPSNDAILGPAQDDETGISSRDALFSAKRNKRRHRQLHRLLWTGIAGGAVLLLITALLTSWSSENRRDAADRSSSKPTGKPDTSAEEPVKNGSNRGRLAAAARINPSSSVPETAQQYRSDGSDTERPVPPDIASAPAKRSSQPRDIGSGPPRRRTEPNSRPDDRGEASEPGDRRPDDPDRPAPHDRPSPSGRQPKRGEAHESIKSGIVAELQSNPRGDVDGLQLDDGTEVRFPAYAGGKLTGVVSQRDRITIKGWTYLGESEIHAATIQNNASGKAVVLDRPPPEISGDGEDNRRGDPEDTRPPPPPPDEAPSPPNPDR